MAGELVGTVIGNYRLDALLGSGGMGEVYRAAHLHLNRVDAVKVMHANVAAEIGRFQDATIGFGRWGAYGYAGFENSTATICHASLYAAPS